MSDDPESMLPSHSLDRLLSEMTIGAAGGLIAGGPLGGAIGAGGPIAQRLFLPVLREFRERVLGQREARRVATVAELAAENIALKQRLGRTIRNDGFFEPTDRQRSDAEELLEGVLLTAQREYQERKLPHYANFLANLAFERAIDPLTANRLLRLVEDLTYTQLVLLSAVKGKEDHPLPPDNTRAESVSWRSSSVRAELDDLGYAKKDLVYAIPREDERLPTNIGFPQDLLLTPDGEAVYQLMELGDIEPGERVALVDALWDYSAHKRPTVE